MPDWHPVLGLVGATVLFALCAYFTRATSRRTLAALGSTLVLLPLAPIFDVGAYRAGWWAYPSSSTGHAPFAWYVAALLWPTAGGALIGWRVARRFHGRGLVGFLAVYGLYGATRDYAISAASGIITFGPGPVPFLADALLGYALLGGALVQLVMRVLAGPAAADPLARNPARAVAPVG